MSTRSMIAHETPDGIEAIYCHSDGYPEHHLPILTGHYATDEAVAALMDLGDLSVLGPETGQAHDFPSHFRMPSAKNWCLAYGRDRGEQDTGKRTGLSEKALSDNAREAWAVYIYLFRDGRWLYRSTDNVEPWQDARA